MDIEALRNEWNELNKEYTELEVSFSIMPLSLAATQLLIDLISPLSHVPLADMQQTVHRAAGTAVQSSAEMLQRDQTSAVSHESNNGLVATVSTIT